MNVKLLFIIILATITGCATIPTGPTLAVMPAPGKPFEVFVADDTVCRQFADRQTGVNPQTAATQDTVSGAAIGTAVGAIAGVAIGAAAGNPGIGAGVGAGTGLLAGTASWCACRVWNRLHAATALQYCLRAMHVRQRKPNSRSCPDESSSNTAVIVVSAATKLPTGPMTMTFSNGAASLRRRWLTFFLGRLVAKTRQPCLEQRPAAALICQLFGDGAADLVRSIGLLRPYSLQS